MNYNNRNLEYRIGNGTHTPEVSNGETIEIVKYIQTYNIVGDHFTDLIISTNITVKQGDDNEFKINHKTAILLSGFNPPSDSYKGCLASLLLNLIGVVYQKIISEIGIPNTLGTKPMTFIHLNVIQKYDPELSFSYHGLLPTFDPGRLERISY